jgi:hypothetical protein
MPHQVDRMNRVGTLTGSQYGDPNEIRNPYLLELEAQNEVLRGRRLANERFELGNRAADPDRARIDAIQAQQDQDYDLEYRAPERVDMMGARAVQGQGWQNRQAEEAASGYFDPYRKAAREDEQGFKRDIANRQYGDSAYSRRYAADAAAESRVAAANANARGGVQRAQIAGSASRSNNINTNAMGAPSPDQQQQIEGFDRNVQGAAGKPFPMERFQGFADQFFGGDPAAAEEALAAEGYYLDNGR